VGTLLPERIPVIRQLLRRKVSGSEKGRKDEREIKILIAVAMFASTTMKLSKFI
jgi:hypothetical protein